eukprot:m.73444 g.73444  ORF g.73444 m.73444 type:complete len:519 (+) comp24559_c0_seq1:535-2091(+)
MIQEDNHQNMDTKPYTYLSDHEKIKPDESFGFDASLTSLKWLQTLNCRSGLNFALQTPNLAPQPRMALLGGRVGNGSKKPHRLIDQLPSATQLDEAIKLQHNIDVNLDWAKCANSKPPHNYAMLIYLAIRDGGDSGKVTLNDIYSYIQTHFLYYRETSQGWKNSIRHNLTQNKFFKKTVRPDNENTPTKGGFWTLNMNMQNVGEFSRGVWKLSKVKMKPSTSKPNPALNTNPSFANGEGCAQNVPEMNCGSGGGCSGGGHTKKSSSKSTLTKGNKHDCKPYKTSKNCKGIKVGKNGSPKNVRRRVSSSSSSSSPTSTTFQHNMNVPPLNTNTASPPTTPPPTSNLKKEGLDELGLEWQTLFEDGDCDFENNDIFSKLYSDSDGCSDTDPQAGYDDVSDDGVADGADSTALPFNFTISSISPQADRLMTISAGSDGCFNLSDDLVKLEQTSIDDGSTAFDTLIASFEDITTDESMQLKDISLEVVGVSMSLLPPLETKERDLSVIMEEMESTNFQPFQV